MTSVPHADSSSPRELKTSHLTSHHLQCDAAWPQCGNCARYHKECSGPLSERKFVQNNNHSATKRSKFEKDLLLNGPHTANPTPSGKLVDINLQAARNGSGTFHKMRILSENVRKAQVPMSKEDVLISRLASFLSTFEGSGYDLSLPGKALKLMACRVSASAALKDSISCLIATYETLREGLPAKDMMDSKTYHRALRSLQRAVDDPQQQASVETLAATTIVHRIQVGSEWAAMTCTTDPVLACI